MDFHVAKMAGEPFSGSAQTRPPPRSAAFIAALRSRIRGHRGECARARARALYYLAVHVQSAARIGRSAVPAFTSNALDPRRNANNG
jgi:hypothetical protein